MGAWKDVLPSMMSEEETDDENFLRRRQCWKSRKFVRFLAKLDSRLQKKSNKSGALAKSRSYGTLDVTAPTCAKTWMVGQTDEAIEEGTQTGDELFSD